MAVIRIYNDEVIKDRISVLLVKEKKLTHAKRMFPSRPLLSIDESHKAKILEQNSFVIRQKEYKSAIVNEPVISVTRFEPIKQINTELKTPVLSYKPREYVKDRILTITRRDTTLREINVKPRIIEGHNILGEGAKLTTEQPKIAVIDDVLKEYANYVRNKIESKKRYPIIARNMGIEGRVKVKLVISKDGNLEKIDILESSGYEILDETAIQSIRDAAPFPPIPEEIKKNKLELSIYMTYEISK
ncbi:MAG: energy transducer TonB [bacterium]